MEIKIKYKTTKKPIKRKHVAEIKEIILKEELINPEDEKISIAFSGKSHSGIIELSKEEFERLIKSSKKTKLIKNFKIIKD